MDKTTAILTGFIVACISAVVWYALYKVNGDGASATSITNSYMTGAFGIITGGAIALPVGYALGKKDEPTDFEKTPLK